MAIYTLKALSSLSKNIIYQTSANSGIIEINYIQFAIVPSYMLNTACVNDKNPYSLIDFLYTYGLYTKSSVKYIVWVEPS